MLTCAQQECDGRKSKRCTERAVLILTPGRVILRDVTKVPQQVDIDGHDLSDDTVERRRVTETLQQCEAIQMLATRHNRLVRIITEMKSIK